MKFLSCISCSCGAVKEPESPEPPVPNLGIDALMRNEARSPGQVNRQKRKWRPSLATIPEDEVLADSNGVDTLVVNNEKKHRVNHQKKKCWPCLATIPEDEVVVDSNHGVNTLVHGVETLVVNNEEEHRERRSFRRFEIPYFAYI